MDKDVALLWLSPTLSFLKRGREIICGTGDKHKARRPNLALTLFYLAQHLVSTWWQCQLLRSSYIYTALKLHFALSRQPRG